MKPEKQTLHYSGRVVSVTTDEVVLPNGHRALLEVVHHPGGAAVAALDRRGARVPAAPVPLRGRRLDLGTAGRQAGTRGAAAATAQRELIEEAGVSAQAWREPRACACRSPGVFSERLYLYMATALATAPPRRTSAPRSSRCTGCRWSRPALWALDGTIADCKTAVGLLRARNMSRRHAVTDARKFRDAASRNCDSPHG